MFGEELCSGSGLRFCECAGNSGTTTLNFAVTENCGAQLTAVRSGGTRGNSQYPGILDILYIPF